MRIPSEVYLKFYSLLLEKFVEKVKEEGGRLVSEEEILSGDIWSRKFKRSKTDQFEAEFISVKEFDVKNHQYFYDRKYNIEKANPETESVNNRSFYKALKFIGIDFPPDFDPEIYKHLPETSRSKKYAEILYDQFKNKHFPDLFNDILVTNPDEIVEFKLIETLIHSFFAAIDSKQFADAWELLSNRYKVQNIWKGNREYFENSFQVKIPLYDTSKDISKMIGRESINTPLSKNPKADIAIDDFTYKYQSIGVTVFHWMCVKNYDLSELYKLHDEYDNSQKRLAGYQMTQIIDDTLGSSFGEEAASVYKEVLRDPNFIAYVMMLSKSDQMAKLLPTPQEIFFYTGSRFDCILENGKWVIDNITDSNPNIQ
ncbi:hypothetical protein FAM09_07120 [Niastella caeni]|uniref:Uncharacterized protein n=1 Tax=Niastella caeni TaxID=2569763 RepID=A0A4S8I155_9BACT|nr:hypothetical protein [Niastella caeni]THU41863.1 hypothetical protein FAM09_07120 [Niastella caeni]